MASSPRRLYWDACAWIAFIQQEKVSLRDGGFEDRGAMCRRVIVAAEKKAVELVTSSLSLVEVCKSRDVLAGNEDQRLRDFFDQDYILLVSLDRRVGDLARQFMLAGHPGLKPPDATHLATAAVVGVEEFHTFDDGLLKLDGKFDTVAGLPLKICKPTSPAAPTPLLDDAV